ncbi:hypothetical protein ACMFMF_009365 [Clarireedia jacksonii]
MPGGTDRDYSVIASLASLLRRRLKFSFTVSRCSTTPSSRTTGFYHLAIQTLIELSVMPGGSEDGVKAGKDVIEQTNNRFKKVKEGEEKADKRRNAVSTLKSAASGREEAKARRDAQQREDALGALRSATGKREEAKRTLRRKPQLGCGGSPAGGTPPTGWAEKMKSRPTTQGSLATHWVPSGWVEKLVGTQWAGQEVENPAHGAPRRSLTPAEVLAAAQARKKKQQDDDERK